MRRRQVFIDCTPAVFQTILSHLRALRFAPGRAVPRPSVKDALASEFRAVVDYMGLAELMYEAPILPGARTPPLASPTEARRA